MLSKCIYNFGYDLVVVKVVMKDIFGIIEENGMECR